MIKINLHHVTGYAFCQSQVYSCKDAFQSITYEFTGGNIYALISDFGRGSWGLATCLGGFGEIIDGDILLNDQKIPIVHLSKVYPKIADALRENKKIVLFPGCRALLKSPLAKKFDYIIISID